MTTKLLSCLLAFAYTLIALQLHAQDSTFTQTEVIYGRKDGMALTMIVATPKANTNGKAIIQVINGGYSSRIESWNEKQAKSFVANGYTVIGVATSSQPRYTVPEELEDLQRAVRYIKYHVKQYGIDPGKLGITGSSSGGSLALLVGTMDGTGTPTAKDPIDRLSSKVHAVTCFAPPTNYLNWTGKGSNILYSGLAERYPSLKPPFDFKKYDRAQFTYVALTDTASINARLRDVSPITYVSFDDAPTLILHGDKDALVPIYQSESLVAMLQQYKVPTQLLVKKGVGHEGEPADAKKEDQLYIDWFNKYLK